MRGFEAQQFAITTKFNRILLDSQWGSQRVFAIAVTCATRRLTKDDSASPVRLFRTSSQARTPRDRGRSEVETTFGSGRRRAFGAGLRAATATLNEQRRSGAQASAV